MRHSFLKSSVFALFASIFLLLCDTTNGQTITNYAGGNGDGQNAVTYGRFGSNRPLNVALDGTGNLFIDNRALNLSTGIISEPLFVPSYVDRFGNKYLISGSQIVKQNISGVETIVAGTGYAGFSGDGSQATSAQLSSPSFIAVDSVGNIYISDWGNDRIRKVNTSGIINTIAGTGTGAFTGDGGPAISADIQVPEDIAVDAAGNVYFADNENQRVRVINTSGIINTYAGNGGSGTFVSGAATATSIGQPFGLIVDGLGNLYISGFYVYKVNASGIITKYAGGGSTLGDGGPAVSASLSAEGIALDSLGNLYIADNGNNRVRKVNTSGIISTVAGNQVPINGNSGNGGPALLADFYNLTAITVDAADNLYVVDQSYDHIRVINSSGIVSAFAGNGILGFSGDGGQATAAELDNPNGLAVDKLGNLYIADQSSDHIRKVNSSGIITTIAGGGSSGLGDGSPATSAEITCNAVAVDSAMNVYISDYTNNRIRKINGSTGIISTVAGNGTSGYTGNGGPATAAEITGVLGVAVDKKGNFYLANTGLVRKVDTGGVITTIAGGGSASPQGCPATSASISIGGVTTDQFGNVVLISGQMICRVDKYGYIHTLTAVNASGYSGDGGPASAARLYNPTGITVDTSGHLFISDNGNYAIREICCLTNTTDNPPVFAGGSSLTVCSSSGASSINSLMAIADADTGDTELWTVSTAPEHGTLGGFSCTATSTGGTVTPTGLTYTPTLGYTGTDQFAIKVTDGTDVNTITIPVTISPLPNAGTISGIATVCSGNTINLNDGTSGGAWSSSNSNATVGTSGVVAGVSAGTDTIRYSVTNSCGTAVATHTLMVNATPAVITGATSVCEGNSITLFDATSGGTWSSNNTLEASVGSVTGVVTGLLAGNPTISYTLPSGCSKSMGISVNPIPVAGTIYGFNTLCAGATTTLTESATGGAWTATNGHATVLAGVVTAISAGTDTILYTVTNSCGTAVANFVMVINPIPAVDAITGPSTVCVSSSITLADAISGGDWTSADPYVSVSSSTGVVAGLAPGTATVTYTNTSSCGTASVSKVVTVSALPAVDPITGAIMLCTGGTITLSDGITGGTWQSANTLVASIGTSGIVTGIAVGAAFVSYTVSNGCGSAVATTIINVEPATPIDPVTGATSVCTGLTTPLYDATSGGTWSSDNISIATVGSTGIVSGVAGGIAVISYTESLGCGLSVATFNMIVNTTPTAGSIEGVPVICTGVSDLLSSYITGGDWSASNGHASVGATGIITGESTGADTIIYTVTNSCGTASTTHTVGVYPSPAPGSISGSSSFCSGTSITLTETATGGIWSSSNNLVAAVGTSGIVSGISGGVAIISYTATTGCGSASATKNITVNAPDAGIIIGATALCGGGSATLTDAVPGGTWSSSETGVATIGTSGVVNAVAPGSTVISYLVTGSCGSATATSVFTVGGLPVVSPISGSATVCAGSTISLGDLTLEGTWSSSNTSVAIVSSGGVVSGLSAGTSTISYIVTAGCGSAGATQVISVQTTPSAGSIAGSASVCQGAATTLTETVTGGIWSSSNTSMATIAATGVVTGVAPGSATLTYAVANVCGSVNTTHNISILPAPFAGTISGSAVVCAGASVTLTDGIPGGTWTSGNTLIALVGSATGVVSGIASGVAPVSYAVTNSCGTAITTATIIVNPLPFAGGITGAATLCSGASVTLADTALGGVWQSSNDLVAPVTTGGVVSGVSGGTVSIAYVVTNGCGTATAVKTVTVNVPNAGSITGVSTLCAGGSSTLTDWVSGGTWSSSITGVATIGSTGVVNAIDGGTTLIFYTVSGVCGTATTSALLTVETLPVVSPITGPGAICLGSTAALIDGTTGGVWSSSNTAAATIGSSGVVNGVAAGTSVISYQVTAGCGTTGAILSVQVQTTPAAGIISGSSSVCQGDNTTLTESVVGGIWSSSNTAKAVVSIGGIVTGIDTGMAIVSYVVSNSCGSVTATSSETIITTSYPGYITGMTNICMGTAGILSDSVSGGTWASSNLTVATISTGGIVTPVAPGSTEISYRVSNSCGYNDAQAILNIDPVPFIEPLYGTTLIFAGFYGALTDVVPGGAWATSDSTIAIVDEGGIVSGIAPGTATITYSLVNSFGCTSDTTILVTVILPTGVERVTATGGWRLFPNPATGSTKISWQNLTSSSATIRLTDVLGREILVSQFETPEDIGNVNLNLKGINPGIYEVSIQSGENTFYMKLIVE